ncbi:MAG: hypothetical protein EOL90_09665 [Spartobacteria bacterium]|nr:hypothetical protein [Spartobacteria bacterium]
MLTVVLLLTGAGCLVALFNWRWGILAAILVSLLQDPLRKLIPGAPAYLVMVAMPIWLATVLSAAYSRELRIQRFLNQFPRLGFWLQVFAAYLLIPAAISATYGRNSWLITLLGAFVYGMMFLMMVAGWQYAARGFSPKRVLVFYAVVCSLMLIGGPLDSWGYGEQYAAIGTKALGHVWVTHRVGSAVYMLAGLFRSPDVMGWHASLTFMVAVIMALCFKGPARWFWILVAVWGLPNIWLCGRRKMLSMVPIFVGCYVLLVFRFKKIQKILSATGTALLIGGIGWYVIASLFRSDAVERFYLTTIEQAADSVQTHGYDAAVGTIGQAGFWGYGLGMSQQGVHNIPNVETPRLWQESGPSKIVAEVGVPGNVLYLIMGAVMFITAYHVVRLGQGRDSFYLTAGIFSILVANVASSVVSAQIFGDPLVAFLLAFLTGLLLSDARPGLAPPAGTETAP